MQKQMKENQASGLQEKNGSEYTKIAFEKIDRIVEETLKGAKQ